MFNLRLHCEAQGVTVYIEPWGAPLRPGQDVLLLFQDPPELTIEILNGYINLWGNSWYDYETSPCQDRSPKLRTNLPKDTPVTLQVENSSGSVIGFAFPDQHVVLLEVGGKLAGSTLFSGDEDIRFTAKPGTVRVEVGRQPLSQ